MAYFRPQVVYHQNLVLWRPLLLRDLKPAERIDDLFILVVGLLLRLITQHTVFLEEEKRRKSRQDPALFGKRK
jgi:hypothetical protein